MAQSTDKTLKQLIINQMPRSVYNAKKAVGELDPEQVYLPDTAYDDSLGVTDAVPGKTIKVKAVQGGKPTEWETADIYEKPASGIPKSDLADDVQTSLDKADTAISYDSQTLTTEQQNQARANIGAGQPLFVVNVTTTLGEQGGEVYTADKTAAEIETAYQAGCEIVCRTSVPIIGMGLVPLQLPLKSRRGRQIFMFASNQTIWTDNSSLIVSYVVTIADDGVSVGQNNTKIYIKPASGIPKSDLAEDVQTSLDKADTAISYNSQTLTEEQKSQARTNIGAVDENLGCNKYNIHVTTTSGTTKDFTYYTNEGEIRQPTEAVDSSIRTAFLGLTLWPSAKGISENLAKTLSKQYKILYDANYIDSPCCIIKSPLESGDKVLLSYHSSDNTVQVSGNWTDGYYNIIYDVANDVLTYFYVDNNISAVNGAVNQLVMSAAPTEDMHIATKQYVDTAKTEAQQLGLTAATPGQIIKVKTVQDGKPTEWETADDRLPKVSASDAGNVLGVEQIGEHEYGYALTHMPTLSDFIPLGIINASPGQFAKVSSVDDFGGPTAWETADIYEKPTSGIPKSDLAQSVQDALDRTWNNMEGKPFSEIGEGLKVDGGKLTVDTTDKIEQGNIKPVTSAAVYTVVGNINAILATI